MINPRAHISSDVFAVDVPKKATRDGFGTGTIAAGRANPNIVVLCADLKESTRAEEFEKAFPERFVELGVAEQNMATVASGMAAAGKVPFAASYAVFNPGRNYEQIRTTIALNRANVKICGMHAGVSVGPDGATHQMLEDIGMMRMLPGMVVLAPGDALEAEKAIVAAAKHEGPVYLRFGRAATPVFTTNDTPFSIGKALALWQPAAGREPVLALLSTGALSYNALAAARELSRRGIDAIALHVPTVKPLDEHAILDAAKRAGKVLTIEEHQAHGGFGSAVAELLSEKHPIPVRRLGIADTFGQSGDPQQLLAYYGLDVPAIAAAAERLVKGL